MSILKSVKLVKFTDKKHTKNCNLLKQNIGIKVSTIKPHISKGEILKTKRHHFFFG